MHLAETRNRNKFMQQQDRKTSYPLLTITQGELHRANQPNSSIWNFFPDDEYPKIPVTINLPGVMLP
jgi:hypothetical protein